VPSSPCVVLTREPEDNLPLARALSGRGVAVREIACVRTRYLLAPLPLEPVSAVAFASRRAVRGFVLAGLHEQLLGGAAPPLVAAVGEGTRAELDAAGIRVALVAEPPTGHALAEALRGRLAPGQRVLVPRGTLGGGGLEPGLRALGVPSLPLVVYANEPPPPDPIAPFPVVAVFVAAPSAAQRLLERAPWLRDHPFLAIGPTTAAALVALGIERILGPAATIEDQIELLVGAHRAHRTVTSAIPSTQR
jgi:uroporphyrinogen-III synthase